MSRIELTPAGYKEYPERFQVSVPVEQVNFSSALESELPLGTTHIEHSVYLGKQNHESGGRVYRKFWEQQSASSRPTGYRASLPEYYNILDEQGVPRPPEKAQWVPEVFLYVTALRMLTAIELPSDPNARQSRVTEVRRDQVPENSGTRTYETVRTPNQYADRLEELGFPQGSFAYLKQSGSLEGRTTPVAEILSAPGLKQLADFVDWAIIGPSFRIPYRVIPNGRLVNSIRTENFRR